MPIWPCTSQSRPFEPVSDSLLWSIWFADGSGDHEDVPMVEGTVVLDAVPDDDVPF